LAALDPAFLKGLLGVNGVALWTFANGADQSRVMQQGFVSPVKSIGHGITCVSDLLNEQEVWKVILELSQDIGHKLRVHELAARTVQVFVRGNNLSGSQFQCKLPFKTQLPSEIAAMAFQAFKEHYKWGTKVRAITVRAIELVPKNQPEQLTLFVDQAQRDKRERLQGAIEEIRGRFGKRAITNAILLGDLKMPDDGRDTVKMPGLMYR
jgi:DNA polymerase-4